MTLEFKRGVCWSAQRISYDCAGFNWSTSLAKRLMWYVSCFQREVWLVWISNPELAKSYTVLRYRYNIYNTSSFGALALCCRDGQLGTVNSYGRFVPNAMSGKSRCGGRKSGRKRHILHTFQLILLKLSYWKRMRNECLCRVLGFLPICDLFSAIVRYIATCKPFVLPQVEWKVWMTMLCW